MQFQSLKVFCEVARSRSFSQAAQAYQVTQSAVSQMVAQIEKSLGNVQLIDRSTRPLQLTPLGRTYFEGCKNILEQYSELEAQVRSAQAQVEGTVQVAAIYSVGLTDMAHYVEAFVAQQPEADVHIEYLHPNQVYDKVLDGSVDLGLVSFPRKSPKLLILPWRQEQMVLACSVKHPLTRCSEVTVAQMEGLKYVHFSKDLVIRREVDRFFRSKRISVDVALEFDNIENIKQAVEISVGISLLPRPTFVREVNAGTLRAIPLADADLHRPLGIIYRRHNKLTNASQGFLDLLRKGLPQDNADTEKEGIFAAGTDHKRTAHKSNSGRNGSSKTKSPNRATNE
jgi:DNA-binding transcriptional LysR family regulator